jgi:hypothetical protein
VELFSVSVGMILVVTLVVDFLLTRGISWSRYTSITLVFIWLCSAIPLILWKHPWLVISVLGPAAILEVLLWFLIPGDIRLFPRLGLPITVLVEGAIVSSGALIAIQKNKGLNAAGIVLAAIGIVCLGIDLCISRFRTGLFECGWSIIVAISALPVAGFFFYLHYRVINRASLRKIFRL